MEDMNEQEEFALQVIDLHSGAAKLLDEVERKLKKSKVDSPDRKNLEMIKSSLKQEKGRYTQPKLISQIRYLYNSFRSADQLPSKDAYERYEELVKELATVKAAL